MQFVVGYQKTSFAGVRQLSKKKSAIQFPNKNGTSESDINKFGTLVPANGQKKLGVSHKKILGVHSRTNDQNAQVSRGLTPGFIYQPWGIGKISPWPPQNEHLKV